MHYTCSQFRSYEQNVVFCQLSNIPRDLSFLPKKKRGPRTPHIPPQKLTISPIWALAGWCLSRCFFGGIMSWRTSL